LPLCTLDTVGAANFSSGTHIQRIHLLSVQTLLDQKDVVPGGLRELAARLAREMDLKRGIDEVVAPLNDGTWQHLLAGPFAMVFLKQFRDISGANASCYQALTQVVPQIQVHSVYLGASAKFQLQNLQSHPIEAQLGVASQAVKFSFSLAFAMTLPDGQVIWPWTP
jgi:hypothetical protein